MLFRNNEKFSIIYVAKKPSRQVSDTEKELFSKNSTFV